jgi:hypothetical protein
MTRNANIVMTWEDYLMAIELWEVMVEMTEESHLSVPYHSTSSIRLK